MTLQIFDDMIGESPSSTVDVDAVFAKERRSSRRRWMAGAGACGLAVVGIAVGVVTYVEGAAPGTPPQVGQRVTPPVASSSPPTPWPPDVVARIEREMRNVVPRVAPGATVSNIVRIGPTWGVVDHPKLTDPPVPRGLPDGVLDGETYGIAATVTYGDRQGEINIRIYRNFMTPDRPAYRCEGYEGECEETTTPEGRFMLINTHRVPAEAGRTPEISHLVYASRGDGVSVWVMHLNGIHADLPKSDAPPLSVEQVKQIALDPALVP